MTHGFMTPAGDAQEIAWIAGSSHAVLLDGDATHGRLTVMRSTFREGAASPVHVHDREDETIVVLSGSAVVWVGQDTWTVSAGDTVFMPREVPHTYLVTSDVAEVVTVCNPAGMEEFFRAAGWDLSRTPPTDWQVDVAGLAAIGERLGQHVLGPPLTDPAAAMPQIDR